ncbi:hypothetical protein [Mariniluteicoccus flavus]
MNRHLRLTAAAFAVLAAAGCGSKGAAAPTAAPTLVAASRPATAVATNHAVTTAAPTATAESSAQALPQAEVTDVRITESGGKIQVSAKLLDAEKRPIVGAVGDFFIEGSPQNLVQSYATRVDGTFASTFTTVELPPEATLMMHYRGDTSTAPGTFALRRGVPKPTTAPPTTARPTPTVAPSATPTPAVAQRPVALTDPDGTGTPRATLTGTKAHVEGRLITAGDGRPVRGAPLTWRAGTVTGQAQTAADGGFALDLELPPGVREVEIAYAGTADRAPATAKVAVA